MSNLYDLGLPSAADMNFWAHPGGGTQVTDATQEGLVEDLFEAHLKHIHVATKSAAIHRLAALATKLDSINPSQSSRVDSLLAKIAEGLNPRAGNAAALRENIQDKITRTIDIIRNRKPPAISNNSPTVTREMAWEVEYLLVQIGKLVAENQLLSALSTAQALIKPEVLEGNTYPWEIDKIDLDELLSDHEIAVYVVYLKEVIADIEALNNLPASARATNTPEQGLSHTAPAPRTSSPAENEARDRFADVISDLFDRMQAIEDSTEGMKSVDPAGYKALSAKISESIPNIAQTQRLVDLNKRYNGEFRHRNRMASLKIDQAWAVELERIIAKVESYMGPGG